MWNKPINGLNTALLVYEKSASEKHLVLAGYLGPDPAPRLVTARYSVVVSCLLPQKDPSLLHGGCTILQTSQSLFLASSLFKCKLCTSSSSPSLCSLDTMQNNLIKDALWGKEKAAAAWGQHIKAEHQLQLNDQLYCKKNNRYRDQLEKRQFIQTHMDPMLCSESGHILLWAVAAGSVSVISLRVPPFF